MDEGTGHFWLRNRNLWVENVQTFEKYPFCRMGYKLCPDVYAHMQLLYTLQNCLLYQLMI